MIPLHDDIPSAKTPVVNYALIVINVLAFFYELSLGPQLGPFLYHWAVVPRHLAHEWGILAHGLVRIPQWLPLLTAMFLHGGWLHIAGNMLFLWIFGDNVEDRLGHVPYLLFYLASGVAATALQVAFDPRGVLPSLGASGAIAGVLGAYLVLYPEAEVLTLVFLGLFLTTLRISAVWFLLVWFALQAVHGLTSLGAAQANMGGVAYWAHVGGFIVGIAVGLVLKRQQPRPPRNRYADRWYSNR